MDKSECLSVDQLRSVDQDVLQNETQYFDTNDVEKYNATIGLHKAEDRPLGTHEDTHTCGDVVSIQYVYLDRRRKVPSFRVRTAVLNNSLHE
jgi:hypothetical protein